MEFLLNRLFLKSTISLILLPPEMDLLMLTNSLSTPTPPISSEFCFKNFDSISVRAFGLAAEDWPIEPRFFFFGESGSFILTFDKFSILDTFVKGFEGSFDCWEILEFLRILFSSVSCSRSSFRRLSSDFRERFSVRMARFSDWRMWTRSFHFVHSFDD